MPHALLLSPDDQAVSAITGVLEEMSVTYERPLDGVSAAQKLNSQSFDLVLVDCENLPAAKLIFDVCRRGKNGNNPVPIAIVDGRAGLPTAFRLGAELILTKPVSKDQARTTIRSAVGRVRKDVPANEGTPEHSVDATLPSLAIAASEDHAHAAAAAASASSQLTSFADFAPSAVSTSVPTPKMHPAVDRDEIAAPVASPAPRLKPAPTFFSESHVPEPASAPVAATAKPKFPLSDDPVLRELETAELEESKAAEPQTGDVEKEKPARAKAAATQPPPESFAPVFSTHPQKENNSRGPLVALLALVIAGGGLYGAWTYEPGFRTIAQPQVDRVLQLAGIAHPSTPAPTPVKPAAQPAAATSPAPAPETTADASKTASAATDSVTNPATASATDSPTPPAAATSTQGGATVSSTSAPSTSMPSAPVAIKTDVGKPAIDKASDAKVTESKVSETKKDTAAASADAPLPGESSAIILSSKGAEKRLAHSIPPKYPAEVRSSDAQGTVVLKEVVDENGKVAGVRLVEGNPTLAAAAIKAVKQWRYRPYERDGKSLPFQTVVIIDFQRP